MIRFFGFINMTSVLMKSYKITLKLYRSRKFCFPDLWNLYVLRA